MSTLTPRSFSATSLQVAELCLARYKAEFIDYGRNFQGSAANTGTVVHGTLEEFLRAVFIRKDLTWSEYEILKIFEEQFVKIIGPDKTVPEYDDARTLVLRWFHRAGLYDDLKNVKILSLEAKNSFPVSTANGIPVNYIMDRLEQLGPNKYRVVDYKSNRIALTHDQLRKKIQARLYALAVQILYPNATEIWVEFDFLRHQPIGVVFTRQDNIATYRMLQEAIRKILATPDTRVPERLNNECGWCVRKTDCKTLQSNIAVGGIFSKTDDELAEIYQVLTDQQKGQQILIDEILARLLQRAIDEDTLEYELANATVRVTAPVRRKPDHALIATILGPTLAQEIGTFTVSAIDKLIKSGRLDPAQVEMLKMAMPKVPGEATVKIEPK